MPCAACRVDVLCHHPEDDRTDDHPAHSYNKPMSPGLLIEDTPKNLAVGVTKTWSATNAAAAWRQVKIGEQMGYEVGKISGKM